MSKIFENRDSFHYNFMIMALSGQEISDKIKDYPRVVTMQINGEEIDPERALIRLEESLDLHIEKHANALIERRIADILEPFEEQVKTITDDLQNIIQAKIKEKLDL